MPLGSPSPTRDTEKGRDTMFEDTFTDAIDATVTAEVIDNGDGEHIIVNLMSDAHGSVGIALDAESAEAMAHALLTLAAGLG